MGDGSASAPSVFNPSHDRHASQTLNAVSFGFIATAVLFAMFLVMAIFERILRPHRTFISRSRTRTTSDEEQGSVPPVSADSQKAELRHVSSYSKAVSVVMPGQDFPTYFARPILPPLPPDGVPWPAHAESSNEKGSLHDSAAMRKGPTTSS